MKKYKLLKWYPTLRDDWKDREITVKNSTYSQNYYQSLDDRDSFTFMDCFDVENNPDFWELVEDRKPLFTTEDGVDIFGGDTYWCIGGLTGGIIENCAHAFTNPGNRPFSTKEAAEKYANAQGLALVNEIKVGYQLDKIEDLISESSLCDLKKESIDIAIQFIKANLK